MPYSVVPVVATGDWITAGWVNTYIGGNMAAMWPGTTAGDMDYYTSSAAKARLPIGQAGSFLYSTGSAPGWTAQGPAGSILYNLGAGGLTWLGGGGAGSILRNSAANTPGWLAGGGQGTLLHNSAANTPGWLASGARGSLLRNSLANTPGWLPIGAAGTVLTSDGIDVVWRAAAGLHTKAIFPWDVGDQVCSSVQPSWTDLLGVTVNLVTTRTCTVVMLVHGGMATNSNGNRALARCVIGGVAQSDGFANTSQAYYTTFSIVHYRASVPAGTITCKVQGTGNASGNQAIFNFGQFIALAFSE